MDTDHLKERDQLEQQAKLGQLNDRLDSLDRRRGELERSRLGAERRLVLLEERLAEQDRLGQEISSGPLPEPDPPQRPEMPEPVIPIDTSGVSERTEVPSTSHTHEVDTLEMEADRLKTRLAEIQQATDGLEATMGTLRAERDRAAALGQVESPSSYMNRHALNIRRLELGDCRGSVSEFLINGLSFQGVSAEVGGERWSISIDHGRSFDDRWRNTVLVEDKVQELQRLFLFEDLPGSNPRKLTAVIVGYRAKSGWSMDVGLLNASRLDVPFGVEMETGFNAPKHRNQVMELRSTRSFGTNHRAELTVARSADRYMDDANEGGTVIDQQDPWSQFTRAGSDNWAASLAWSSDLPRTKSRLGASARAVGADFQSLGVAFLRSDSRNVSVFMDQSLGRSIRMRLNGMFEERGASAALPMTIQRLRWTTTWRVARGLRVKAGAIPQWTRSTGMDGLQRGSAHLMVSSGFDADVLRGRTTVNADGEVARYGLSNDQLTTVTHIVRGGLRARMRNGTNATIRVNTILANDTTPSSMDLSSNVAAQLGSKTKLDAQGTLPLDRSYRASWSVGLRRELSERWTVSISAGRIGRPDIFFDALNTNEGSEGYTCELRTCYSW